MQVDIIIDLEYYK